MKDCERHCSNYERRFDSGEGAYDRVDVDRNRSHYLGGLQNFFSRSIHTKTRLW